MDVAFVVFMRQTRRTAMAWSSECSLVSHVSSIESASYPMRSSYSLGNSQYFALPISVPFLHADFSQEDLGENLPDLYHFT